MVEQGSAFKLVMGFAMIMIVFLLWIPLNEMTGEIGDVLNNMTTGNATYDQDMIERNNIATAIFGGAMIFMFLVFGIWVFKSSAGDKGGVVS